MVDPTRRLRFCVIAVLSACSAPPINAPVPQAAFASFERDLEVARATLRIPGMTAAIVSGDSVVWQGSLGFADVGGRSAMHDTTAFPVASITKTMAAAVVVGLAREGRLGLDSLVPLLSHTSEGRVGEEYLYSGSRYNRLGPIIERASGKSLGVVMRERIFEPLAMTRTSAGPDIGAASGVVSTSSDLARYAIALMHGDVLRGADLERMWTPTRSTLGTQLPYGLGWFVQDYGGERLVWHYGQEDAYGSLLLLIPARKLAVVVLANSNAISDAARLLDGNVAWSLIAQAFLRNVAKLPLPADDLMIAQAFAELYVGHRDRADSLTRFARVSLVQSTDLSLFYLLFRLGDPSFDPLARAIEARLLGAHPRLPPLLYFAALFELRAGSKARGMELLERIAMESSPPRHWSVVLGLNELGSQYETDNPPRARQVYQKVVDMNYNFGGAVDRAKARLATLK